jgi:hypothetical protein
MALTPIPLQTELKTEYICDFHIEPEQPIQQFQTPMGVRLTYIVRQGQCEGPDIKAEFLPGGGDWVLLGSDGIARLDARATLRLDDGALCHVTILGAVQGKAEDQARFFAGETLRWDEVYARATPRFETGSAKYAWLNGVVAVAYMELSLKHVDYKVYRLL